MGESQTLYKTFCDAVRSKKVNFDEKTVALINIAQARYNFAKFFAGVQSNKYKEPTLRGYSASMRVFLAFTALEMMDEATAETKGGKLYRKESCQILGDSKFLEALRKFLNPAGKEKTPLVKIQYSISDKDLKNDLDDFAFGKNNNLMVLAYALRVMVAHGFFTPTGTKMLTQKNAKLFHQLSDSVLEKTQSIFAEWLQKNI